MEDFFFEDLFTYLTERPCVHAHKQESGRGRNIDAGLDLRTHDLSQSQALNQLSYPGTPREKILKARETTLF